MQTPFLLDKHRICPDLDELIHYAQTLEKQGNSAKAIQVYDTLLVVGSESVTLAQANFHLGKIYREWDEVFAAQRFLGQAYQFAPDNVTIKAELDALNRYFAENQAELFEVRGRKNDDQIVSLFRIATGLKLLQMDKAAQAYPLMKSRTKIYPNAAIAKHLLTNVMITEDDQNSAITSLVDKGWLVNTQHDLYSITESGLYAFYTGLAQLHAANEVYDEASACYEQAYWLDDSAVFPLYHKVICDAKSQAWESGLATLDLIAIRGQYDALFVRGLNPRTTGINPTAYASTVAQLYGLAYRATQDKAIGLRAIVACEAALAMDKKNKEVTNLLKSLRSEKVLHVAPPSEAKPKKSWWHR